MKQIPFLVLSVALALFFADSLFAEQWTDPATNIMWEYHFRQDGSVTLDSFHPNNLRKVIVPNAINGNPVSEIGGCFGGRIYRISSSDGNGPDTHFQLIDIPASITTIQDDAFWGFIGDFSTDEGSAGVPVDLLILRGRPPKENLPYNVVTPLKYMKNEYGRFNALETVLAAQVRINVQAENVTPKKIRVTYTVKSDLQTVKVRAVAFKDGVRELANIIPVRTGENIPNGESIATNVAHSFVWDVASDWSTDLGNVAVEILVQEGMSLSQELITIPATRTHKAMTFTKKDVPDAWLFDTLLWAYAERDSRLTVTDGVAYVDGIKVYDLEPSLPTDRGFTNDRWKSYQYTKIGFKKLESEDLSYAEDAMRMELNGCAVKIDEGE